MSSQGERASSSAKSARLLGHSCSHSLVRVLTGHILEFCSVTTSRTKSHRAGGTGRGRAGKTRRGECAGKSWEAVGESDRSLEVLEDVFDVFLRAHENGSTLVDARRDNVEDALLAGCGHAARLFEEESHLHTQSREASGTIRTEAVDGHAPGTPRTACEACRRATSCPTGTQRCLRRAKSGGNQPPSNRCNERCKASRSSEVGGREPSSDVVLSFRRERILTHRVLDALQVLDDRLVPPERVALVEGVDLAAVGNADVGVREDELADALRVSSLSSMTCT